MPGLFGIRFALLTSTSETVLLLLSLAYSGLLGAALQEPDTIDIPAPVSCEACRILLDSVVVLGDSTGGGIIDRSNEIAAGADFYYLVDRVVSDEIAVFRRDGTFHTSVGRRGEGPGEYRDIRALWVSPGDTLHVIDAGLLRRTVLSPAFEVVRTDRLPGRVLHYGYTGLGDGSSILAAIAPDSAGNLKFLHRISKYGEPLLSFGDFGGEASEASLGSTALVRIPVETKNGEVLVTHGNDFLLEAYREGGTLERVLRFMDREFLELVPAGDLTYAPWIQDLRVDEAGRLWVMMRIGDPKWETSVERITVGLHRRPGLKITDYDSYWDTVIEVIDLEKGETIVRRRFEKYLTRFLGTNEVIGGTFLDGITYRLPVYRLRMEEPR
jgi:hypothetical protein